MSKVNGARPKIGLSYPVWLRRRKPPFWPEMAEIVVVVWQDAVMVESEDGDAQPIIGCAVGVVIEADETHIQVAQEIFEDETTRNRLGIPAGMVRSVVPLARARIRGKA